MPSGLLAPRANTKASVQWANKYSVLLLRQPGFKSSWSHGTLTPLSLFAPTSPSFSHQSFIWDQTVGLVGEEDREGCKLAKRTEPSVSLFLCLFFFILSVFPASLSIPG